MISHVVPKTLILLLMLLSACAGSDGESGSSENRQAKNDAQTQVTVVPLANRVGDGICSLTRHSTESDVIAIFGQPDERRATGDMVLLSWRADGWSADAMFGSGKLKVAGANAKQNHKRTTYPLDDDPAWIVGETRRDEMESRLGPGVRVGVRWHAGSDVAPSIRNSPGFDESITRDRCNESYAWSNLDMVGFSSFLFADEILRGAL